MVDEGTAQQLRRVFDKQRANRWQIAQSTADERIAKLLKLRGGIWAWREEIHRAIREDYRKHPGECDVTEIYPTIAEINHTVKHLRDWMKPIRVGTPWALFGTHSEIRLEPKGMVLIISPWNYPFNLLINPLVAAIAAGNCVIAKPSSKVPHTARLLGRFISDLFEENEVALFEGSSAVADSLLELPFDHVFFTGSPRVGKTVMAAAAEHLASVTLELGGKSPVIVDETADIPKAAARILWGKFINVGQTCVAPDYLLIHEGRLAAFLTEAKRLLAARYGETEEARKASPDLCRLVSDGHLRVLKGVLDDAVAAGAEIAIGGVTDYDQRYLSPTLLTNVREDSPIMAEEIFGPILPILTFSSLDEVLRIIRAKAKPLALYIFSSDDGNVERVLRNTTAGGTCVNSTVTHVGNPNLPFGGVGHSGMGNYHGYFGFRSLSHERAVLRQGRFDLLKNFYPPYNEKVSSMIRLAMKYLT